MGQVIAFRGRNFSERMALLRYLLDEAEASQKEALNESDVEDLMCTLEHVWPGTVAWEDPWLLNFSLLFLGFAIGFAIFA